MAQTGYTPILIYSSSTTTNVPAAGNLTNSTLGSELAINITDGKLFYKDNTNAIQVIGWKTTPTSAGGTGLISYTAGDLLYYATGTTLSKLAIGASTTIMTSSGSAPQWSAASGITVGTATNIAGGAAGSVPYQTGAGATSLLAIGASGRYLSSSGSAPQWNAPAALTKTDDTNVTLTLGGSASTALLNAASLTLGWTGSLAVSRGGTGTGTAGIAAFNNITGYTASGATGTTSTNLVFSGSPTIASPTLTGDSVSTGTMKSSLFFSTTQSAPSVVSGTLYDFPACDIPQNSTFLVTIKYVVSTGNDAVRTYIVAKQSSGAGSGTITSLITDYSAASTAIAGFLTNNGSDTIIRANVTTTSAGGTLSVTQIKIG